ncbi:LLM class flavin-dependent oxidoreductase [Leifsonia sp. TF02-11]|uniref:LLM class flavin-dependent oxidoreductase n=1 Tax=Leifsonia sp. TF02-11 TaxID=2815212 RepID=UPI001AA15892|nr:LLM class flavin-dependent oxidoreductase [Leifsonia sp. TF02-11]MBO1739232.1 LLM class flavin-dependent oxidoreductase [Leifsonia sp. TF02-11]
MKVIGLDLIANAAGGVGRAAPSPRERLAEVVANARLFEELGFDGFAVGERHHAPFLSSSPTVLLGHLAAVTSRIRLFTGVTLLSVLDPVRVAEDYATIDHLSGGRLELIIGKGNGPEQAELFGIERTEAWETLRENYSLLRRLWSSRSVDWDPPIDAPGIRHSPLRGADVQPRPLQSRIRIWHGSATSPASVELAARGGDPIFSANAMNPIEQYAALVRRYREVWAETGRDPADATVGAGHVLHVARTSQQAREEYRPAYEAFVAAVSKADHSLPGTRTDYADYDDYVARSSALIGSPQEVLDKLARYHEAFGHTTISIGGHPGQLKRTAWVDSLELFRSDVRPAADAIIGDPEWPVSDAETRAVAEAVPA